MLRVQRYVNDIENIISKTKIYGRELGIVGKYLKINIKNNIKNYLDMICEKREITREELTIIINEFNEYLDYEILDEYCKDAKRIEDNKDNKINKELKQIDEEIKNDGQEAKYASEDISDINKL